MTPALLVLYNPVSGDRSAESFFKESVLPLLAQHEILHEDVVATTSPGHAGAVVIDFVEAHDGNVTILLGSGDGTLHEIINHLSSAELKGSRASAQIHFVLVPCGTANAIFSSFFPPSSGKKVDRLQAVKAYVNNTSAPRLIPLTLAISTVSPPPKSKDGKVQIAISAVVASTALHASILQDSEALRETVPGIERFKMAAKHNISRWYNASVKLLPIPAVGHVQIYQPESKTFVPHEDSLDDDPIVDAEGPFQYFVSTVNVDRLETEFCITPLHSTILPLAASMDIVMVRPFRDPYSSEWDSPQTRTEFVPKAFSVLQHAYQNGAHINLRYDTDGTVAISNTGELVVEYIRCGGWEWIPNDDDDAGAHIFCSDGTLLQIEKGGKVSCTAATPVETAGFMIVA